MIELRIRTVQRNLYLTMAQQIDYWKDWEVREDFTQCLDLSSGQEALWRACSRGHRQDIRQAVRKGVTCRLANSFDD